MLKLIKNKNVKINPELLNKIQVQGGISFKNERFISTGSGFTSCIHIYELPKNVDTLWLSDLVENMDCITTIDIFTPEHETAIKNVDKNMKEQKARYETERDESAKNEALNEYHEMEQLLDEINSDGEILKFLQVRLFVNADNTTELEEKTISLVKKLQGKNFRGAVFLNQTEYEFKSLFQSYSKNLELDVDNEGLPIQSYTLASGLPFNFSQLKDPQGFYLGETSTGGMVMFNQFHKDLERLSYEAIIIGKKGAGKSTLIKTLSLHTIVKNNYIRIFDPSDEFISLILMLGGKIINLDGSNGIQNILDIQHNHKEDLEKYNHRFKNASADEVKEIHKQIEYVEQTTSFTKNLNKVRMFYSILSGTTDESELALFDTMVKKLYDKWGLKPQKNKVTGLNSNQYPILSDLLHIIKDEVFHDTAIKKRNNDISVMRADMLEKMVIMLENIIDNYGTMFNGHSTIEKFFDEPIICFNIKGLKQITGNVYDAQMFNICNLLWDNMISNGSAMKKAYENGEIANTDIRYYNIIIDEAHRVINTNKPLLLDFFIDYNKEARKYFAGMCFAFHNIRDVVPEGSTKENIDKIKILFELIQYKFMMKQDSNSIESLLNVFQNDITHNEVKMIPSFQQGQTLLIGAGNNIKFNVDVSDEELDLFKGGV